MSNTQSPVNMALLFAEEDEAWRVALLNHLSSLKNEGRITLWDVSQILPGTSRVAAIEQHLESAAVILLLVSAACLASHDREIEQVLRRQKTGNALVVSILLHPVDWQQSRLSHLQPLPGNGKPITLWQSQEAAFAEVVAGIRKALPEALHLATHAPASTLPPIWNIPYPRNPYFTGRDEMLTRLAEALKTGQATALSQPQAISGLGGIGKTQIAVEFAYQHRNEYQAVLWMLSDSRESLVSGYIALARLLNLPEKDEQDQAIIIQAVKNWLQTHGSWLLILDNADDLTMVREFIPSVFGGHLLLTTRAQSMGRLAKRIEVDTMDKDMGALFLLRRAGLFAEDASLDTGISSDVTTAHEISEELGGLPLALDQAGAFIEETQCSLTEYLDLYRTQRAELLKERGGLVDDHREPVATTWSISFARVEEKNVAAADLLRLCAFLAPDAISEEIITKGAEHLGSHLQEVGADPLLLKKAIASLGAYSLVRRNAPDKILSIHRLVQVVLRDTMDEPTQKQWEERTIKAVNAVFPEVEFETWPQCERYLPHALVCAELIEQESIVFPEAGSLLNRAGWYLKERARYSEAEPLIKQGLAIRQQCFEPVRHEIANSLSTLGYLYIDQGRFAEAEPVWQQALTIDEAILGLEDRNVAANLNNLAELYRAQGKYQEAEPLYQRALKIYEQKLGAMHPDTAISLNNLALLYQNLEKHGEAEPLFQQALAIREQVLGTEHPDTAVSVWCLAFGCQQQQAYEKAEPLYRRAFSVFERTLGLEHPDTQRLQKQYISLLRKMGRDTEATTLEQGQLPSEEH